ncbi:hypothetical protein J6590_030588 [Homalodisca vitripennis]|nr:hypothetical protein J6590_030588 [Homalodisca vitripennis]
MGSRPLISVVAGKVRSRGTSFDMSHSLRVTHRSAPGDQLTWVWVTSAGRSGGRAYENGISISISFIS